MKIFCQICDQLIATAEPSSLHIPLSGAMFGPPYPDRMPHSLIQPTEWEYIRCPMCSHRPFIRDDEVMTDDGIYRIPVDVEEYNKSQIEIEEREVVNYYRESPNQDGVDPPIIEMFYCTCCDPPKEFDSERKRFQHVVMKKRWAKRKEKANTEQG